MDVQCYIDIGTHVYLEGCMKMSCDHHKNKISK